LKIKLLITLIGILTIIVLSLSIIEIEVTPPAETRLIIEKTYKTYISPPCYEQAQKTNNLAEVTLQTAIDLKYKPESSCTELSLEGVNQPVLNVIAEKIGLKKGKWDW
jgi:hypothetical protein